MSRLMTPARSTYGVSLAPHALDLETFPDSHGYDPRLVRMLVKNYRSHPAIIKLPSKMFYQDALEPFADPVLVE
jgi:superfamily I DNA and/or RNA helicase